MPRAGRPSLSEFDPRCLDGHRRKKIEACFAAFVTGVQDEETLGKARTEPDGARIETFEPGMIEYLEPGRDVKFASPSASGGYAEYMRHAAPCRSPPASG